MPATDSTNDAALLREAAVLTRLIVGRQADPEFAHRYVAAHRLLLPESIEPVDAALISMAMHRPWLLPCIDTALALRRPDALLHRKSMLMAAILEASPQFADDFLPRQTGLIALAWLGLRIGATTAVQLAIGLPIVWWCGRARRAPEGARP
jgi:hypothetical protein